MHRFFPIPALAAAAGFAVMLAPRPAHACVPAPCGSFAPEPDQAFPANHVAFPLPAFAELPRDLGFQTAAGVAVPGVVKSVGKSGRAFVPVEALAPGAYRLRYRPAACLGEAAPQSVAFSATAAAPFPTVTGKLARVTQRPVAHASGPALEVGFELTTSAELARFANAAFPVRVDGRIVAGPVAPPQKWRPGQPIALSLLLTCAAGTDKDGWSGDHDSCGSLYRSVPAGRHTLTVPAFVWGIDQTMAPAELPFEVVCEAGQPRVVDRDAPDAGCQMAPGARATAPIAVALLFLLLLAFRSRPAPVRAPISRRS